MTVMEMCDLQEQSRRTHKGKKAHDKADRAAFHDAGETALLALTENVSPGL